MSTFNTGLRSSTAAAALLGTLGATAAFAQAAADFDFGALPASIAYNTPTDTADVGDILAQQSTGTVAASGTGNNVSLLLQSNTASDQTYNGSYTEQSNLFFATANANETNSSVIYSFTPTNSGDTAVAGSYQTRIDSTSDVTANVSSGTHRVDISNADTGSEAILTGTLVVDDNDITASATANNAISAITLGSGVNVLEDAATQASVVSDTTIPSGLDSDNSADILVSSAQVTSGETSVVGEVLSSDVEVDVESVDGATVTVSNSNMTADATGNLSSGEISSSDTSATITASAAVSNLQLLDIGADDAVAATVSNSTVSLEAGETGTDSDEGQVDNSTLSIVGNTLASVAEGNDSNQSVDLVANAITGSGTADFSDSDATTPGVQVSAVSDVVAANTQVITSGTTVRAATTGSDIFMEIVDAADGTIQNNTLNVSGNSLASTARAADTSNSITLQAGSTMSATGVVANVQDDAGSVVTARTNANQVRLNIDDTGDVAILDSTVGLVSNTLTASATGARADNDLTVADGTNNLALETNTGAAVTILADPAGATEVVAPSVSTGFAVVNDQARAAGTVTAEVDSSVLLDMSDSEQAVTRVTANNNLNSLSATASGGTADNQIALNFNALTGTLATTGGDNVAITANNQTITGDASITARTQHGTPVRTEFDHTVSTSTVTTSSNSVSAVAFGNQTTNNDIVVDATDVVIVDGIDASPSTNLGTGVFGDLTASGAFVAASVQEIDNASVLATQVDTGNTSSNLIETDVSGNVDDSTFVSGLNVLSVLAVGNEAANGVTVGTATTSTLDASSASANVQLIRSGDIDGAIGVLGSDASPGFTATFGFSTGLTDTAEITNTGANEYTTSSNLTLTFSQALTAAQADYINSINGLSGAAAGSTTVIWSSGIGTDFSWGAGISYVDEESGTGTRDSLSLANFSATGSGPTLNNAGVIISRGENITDSSFSVTDNTIAGEIRGNVATNTTSVSATTITASSTTTASTDVNDTVIAPFGASTVVTNLQNVDETADLDMEVAGTFAIRDEAGDPLNVTNSQQNVDDNLQQSYATANRATNAITITATNSTADGVIENDQRNAATVNTGSDLDLMAAAGMSNSAMSIDGNRNESVASGNFESSTLTVRATNVSEEDGTASNASVNKSTDIATGDAIIGTEQYNGGVITASATTDAFNEEINLSGTSVDNIDGSMASISSNVTIAQATANNSTLANSLGSTSTANYDASGAVSALQESAANVNATTNVEVDLALNDDDQTVQSSTVSLNGNQASATARGNVLETDLAVAGGTIEGGTAGNNAVMNGDTGANAAAFVVSTEQQSSAGTVTANSSAMRVVLDLTTTSTIASDATLQSSTATLSSNRSTATATVNDADTTLALGQVASAPSSTTFTTSSLTATGGLLNIQTAGAALATGGMSISAEVDSTETGTAAVNAVAGSQLSLGSNVSTASATGNTADNTLTAVATNITAGTSNDANATSTSTVADAGFSLLNEQNVTGAVESINTDNTVSALLSANDTAVTSSTVSLSDNSVSALSVGNDAENILSLGLAGTTSTLSSTGALVSNQSAGGSTLAEAGVTVTTDIDSTEVDSTALSGSTLTVSGNTSVASATNNNVLNTFSAVGTNMTAGAGSDATTSGNTVDAAYAIASRQDSSGVVTATNTANFFTVDVDSADLAVGTSTIGLSSNIVSAQATGNIAVNNSMALGGSGTALISATGAINNSQTNSAVVDANADSTVRVSLDTSDLTANAVNGSTVTMQNNATTALARGNLAQNTLSVTSAGATGGSSGLAQFSSGGTLTAAYGVLNAQTNTGAVTGTIAGTSYDIALNAGTPSAGAAGSASTYSLSGNTVDAIAYGNVATNSVTLTSLNGPGDDATAMVANVQNNSGVITAQVSNSNAGFSANGVVSGSTVGVTGNAIGATAVGNFATSVVTRN